MDSPDIASIPQDQLQMTAPTEVAHVTSSEIKVPLIDPENRGNQRIAEKFQDALNNLQDKLGKGKHFVIKASEFLTVNPSLAFAIQEYTDDIGIGSVGVFDILRQHALVAMPNLTEIVNQLSNLT